MTYKKFIGVALVIITISIGYYFTVHLPSQEQKKLLFEKQQYCQRLGQEYSEKESQERNYTDGDLSSLTGNAQYTYSQKSDTCLYANSVSLSSSKIMKTENYIIDLSTNTTLASEVRWDRGCDDCSQPAEALSRYLTLYDENF